MITQNSGLRRHGIFNYSIPALAAKLADGRNVLTCPSAGVCANVCYARTGTYQFPQVKAKHARNLARYLDDPRQWRHDLVTELAAPKYRNGKLRVHDSGDYFSDDYVTDWMTVARAVPDVLVYSYTKEISRFKRLVEPDPPENFAWVYSYGGKEDHLINPATDRMADVFPSEEAITAAGWHTNAGSDLDAVLGPSPVGMAQNRIPHLRKAIGQRTFREWQATERTGTASAALNHPQP
ncbi:hypothetical protein BBK82_10800 [Lentzea guizhouensis]|uniref:Gene product 88 domain-containing protein n=1 Tax=Lentzea guizhouensis TaxID=1586287 RepID=A0A1B2HFJ5_9PSEU|nr:hypothetical protein [Lentzea guizhouensis]ANZ36483.1 hypothetical protein BBK82_10800 [Lentzea guizhouensis]